MTRDQFLFEKMGERWSNHYPEKTYNPNFSTWEGFGKLWEWAKEQEWWEKEFVSPMKDLPEAYNIYTGLIQPDRFSDAIAKFLGWKE